MTTNDIQLMRDAAIKTCVRDVPNLAKTLAEEVFGIPFDDMVLHPTEFPPLNNEGKTNIADVLFQLKNGGFLDVEAHNGPPTIEESGQVQLYAHRMGVDSVKKGQGFKLPPIYLMMLINDESQDYDKLIEDEVNFKQGVKELLGNHVHIKFVYLSYTKKMMEEKGIKGMSVAELLLYIFAYGIPEGIEERKEQVIVDMISIGTRFFDRRRGSLFTLEEYEELMRQKQIAKEERYRKGIENEAVVAAWAEELAVEQQEMEVQKQEMQVQKQEMQVQKQEMQVQKQAIETQIKDVETREKEIKEKELKLQEWERKLKMMEDQQR